MFIQVKLSQPYFSKYRKLFMSLTKEDQDLIRHIEGTLLDTHHRKFLALGLPLNISVPFILKLYGDATRDSNAIMNYNEFTFRRIMHQLVLAISQAIKWVINDGKSNINAEPLTYVEINPLINDLVGWAFEYTAIAQQFTAWSRGFLDVEIDKSKKEICFLGQDNLVHYFYYTQQEISDDNIDKIYDEITGTTARTKLYNEWNNEYKITEPPIASYIDWAKARNSELHAHVINCLKQHVMPELSPTTDLGGYSLEEFRLFYSVLFINFDFICSYEKNLDASHKEMSLAFGTNPILFPKDKMIKLFCEASYLDYSVVARITEDLTLDTANFHSNLITQPIVEIDNNKLAILPNLFAYTEPNRMISGALNKSKSKKKIYDHLINKIEACNIEAIESCLKERTDFTIVRKSFNRGLIRISPDFVIIHPDKKSLLIIDYKHFLSPINAVETTYKMHELNKGFKQINNYERFFDQNTEVLQEYVNNAEVTIYKLIVTRYPVPVSVVHSDIWVSDLQTFKKNIIQISQFFELDLLFKNDARIEIKEQNFNPMNIKTELGDWTFSRLAYSGG